MQKLDLTKQDRAYYSQSAEPIIIELGVIPYLTIIGKGNPSGPEFASATEALFTLAYAVKFLCKTQGQDFTVAKLEGAWWVDGGGSAIDVPRDEWHWKIRIRMPDFVTAAVVEDARPSAIAKKKDLSLLRDVTFEEITEGLCVQMLHVGPYADEPTTMQRMHEFMDAEKLKRSQRYHIEVYLSDPRKGDPAKMKTIIRFPVAS